MALVPCPDCGREVSAAALTCPQCGRPMNAPAPALPAPTPAPTVWVTVCVDCGGRIGAKMVHNWIVGFVITGLGILLVPIVGCWAVLAIGAGPIVALSQYSVPACQQCGKTNPATKYLEAPVTADRG